MNKKYKIKYNYDTGDSFNTEKDQEGILELSWGSLDVAKENLQRIKEHYKYYELMHKRSCYLTSDEKKQNEKIIKESKKKDWFVNGKKYDQEYCLILKTDDGKDYQLHAPWCGYFESLNEAEIIEDNSDRKISFR